jgi:hypothetical protein
MVARYLDFRKKGNRLKRLKKAFPLQAWTGPWGSRRLKLQNF